MRGSDRDREFAEFVADASVALQRTAYVICWNEEGARDAVQEALCRLYVGWTKARRADALLAYARRAVVNAAIDQGRRPWRREYASREVPDRAVHDTTAGHAERDEMLRVLRQLPPRRRACIALRFYEGLTVEETAEVLGCSAGTVKSQTARGLDTLRQLLTDTGHRV